MNIKFVDTKVISLIVNMSSDEITEDNEESLADDFKFTIAPAFNDLNKKEFLIIFNLDLKSNEFHLVIEYAARFTTDDEIDEMFKNSNFVNINAPAIAYPFLRAYISNITINSGYQPVVLPTINFTNFEKNL